MRIHLLRWFFNLIVALHGTNLMALIHISPRGCLEVLNPSIISPIYHSQLLRIKSISFDALNAADFSVNSVLPGTGLHMYRDPYYPIGITSMLDPSSFKTLWCLTVIIFSILIARNLTLHSSSSRNEFGASSILGK